MTTSLIAVDLDRTLIYSRAAAEVAGAWPDAQLLIVESTASGHQSFMTRTAARLLAGLAEEHVVVPVTTRTREQLARITLPGRRPRFAVAANGGALLVDGVLDPEWTALITERLTGVAPLDEALERLRTGLDPAAVLDVRVADALFCYAILDRAALSPAAVERLAAWAGPAGWVTSLQGRKLYLVPRPLTKSAAIAHVAERAGVSQVLAAGDSLLDRELLSFADLAVRPGHGELAAAGWCEPHVTALDAVGLAAGEQIVAWLATHARALAQSVSPAALG